MGRQEDIVFCKVAIQAGYVSEDQAQKCLALCDRREREGNRRPMIGALFTKHNLLSQDQAQQVNHAVRKRLGTPAPGTAAPRGGSSRGGAGRRGGGGAGRAAAESSTRSSRRRDRSAQKIDPNTLWMGIGTGVVFLGVVLTIVILYIRAESGEEVTTKPKKSPSADSSGSPTPGDSGSGGSTGGSSAAEKLEEARIENLKKTVDPDFKRKHDTAIHQARQDGLVDNNPAAAVKFLRGFIERNKVEYAAGGEQLLDDAKRLIGQLEGNDDDGGGGDELDGDI